MKLSETGAIILGNGYFGGKYYQLIEAPNLEVLREFANGNVDVYEDDNSSSPLVMHSVLLRVLNLEVIKIPDLSYYLKDSTFCGLRFCLANNATLRLNCYNVDSTPIEYSLTGINDKNPVVVNSATFFLSRELGLKLNKIDEMTFQQNGSNSEFK